MEQNWKDFELKEPKCWKIRTPLEIFDAESMVLIRIKGVKSTFEDGIAERGGQD